MPGSAAEKGGLLAGDRLLEANGRPFGDDPLGVLDPYLQSGEPIDFKIVRDGEEKTLRVRPAPR